MEVPIHNADVGSLFETWNLNLFEACHLELSKLDGQSICLQSRVYCHHRHQMTLTEVPNHKVEYEFFPTPAPRTPIILIYLVTILTASRST